MFLSLYNDYLIDVWPPNVLNLAELNGDQIARADSVG